MDRNAILERIKCRTGPWDIVVIGGGATGVGCALDAASRGFDVLLLEQHDFGKGTSSRSTKLIHGGVRYLAQGNISLVREALEERGILLRNASHIVHKQAFIVPCYSIWQKIFYGTGLKIYDLLAGKFSLGKSRILSRQETLEKLPGVKKEDMHGGVLYFDGQFDDTRLLIDLVKTAHEHGAALLNYAKVKSLVKDHVGKISGVEFEDVETGKVYAPPAKVVINATGGFCDGVRKLSDDASKPLVTLSRGIHLVFHRKLLPCDTALMIPKTSDGRVLFCIPWHDHTLVGTTDTPTGHIDLEPHVLESEIDFVLKTASGYLARKPTRENILSVFAGIRPLVKSGASKNTASLSRGHMIEIDSFGLVTITGGKWTTYRRMAEDAVDQALRVAGLENRPSITQTLFIKATIAPNADSGSRLHDDLPYTAEDVIRGVRKEMARTVEDVLARRTRALFLNARAAIEMAAKVAEIMAKDLDRNEEWIKDQLKRFKAIAGGYARH